MRFSPAAPDAPRVAVVGSASRPGERLGARAPRGTRDRRGRPTRAGGLLMYGIPNMKLPKDVVERRVALMRELGIEFRLETDASEADGRGAACRL